MKFTWLLILISLSCCGTRAFSQYIGKATYYSNTLEGRKTSSGEVYRAQHYTAAHKTLPLGSYVEVQNTTNNQVVKVKINDRLHAKSSSMIDLSYAAAKELNMIKAGSAKVKIVALRDSASKAVAPANAL